MQFRRLLAFTSFAALAVTVGAPAAAQDKLVEIERLRPRSIEVAGFQLSGEQSVSIEATGIRYRTSRYDLNLSSAWILNADSRSVVWNLRDAREEDVDGDLRIYKDRITLPAGRYEVYYAAWPSYRDGIWDDDDDDRFDFSWGKVFDRDYEWRDYRRAARDFRIVVTGQGKALYESDVIAYQEQITKDAILSRRELDDDHYETVGLKLERPMKLEVYAIGEANKDGNYDYSWIVNQETRETMWRLDYRHSERAGGAKKNRMAKETIDLPAGTYAVFIATDDSHHFDDWNDAPPFDPYFWGVTIQAANPNERRFAKIEDFKAMEEKNVVLKFSPLRDDDFESRGFSLKRPTKLRLYAVGEGIDGEMADYSWIVNADTRETVWEFSYRRSDHAGGSSKNRMMDETIELPAGNYVAYAVTDGSHAYRHWNAAAPHDREHWGLTIFTLDEKSKSNVGEYEETKNPNVIAQIVRVGDNDYERETFTLDKRTKVRVYALGEGHRGRMYDYAWIENRDTGRVEWEMSYRKTDHAGGAEKNRLFNDTVTLDAGTYVLYYESDGSHSFQRWNARPPADMWNWGVTVLRADGES